ncbi:ABC transporter ATP-binding protein [Corynebacterium liangguodongii]|uniref:ABC transporter ATP-binding protein n=1 Tax=Corynebacterium liangguodongii TaxID=2079535 RepID=A0A2S0WGT9_9CORY|nr:ABC transporter ATP-binding protein [Corynebacterium liangguodongii]AWB84991.1 ABC transporter ATP-binding protein [Corynebacterium liangguodongii]PWC00689.1 ABC transporter ATP-binding protein [Corynebacterium liangguodongii]
MICAGYGGGPEILHGVTVHAEPGQVTTLVGPNGCGKSTLLKTMSRLLPPRSGAVHVGEVDVHALPPRRAARLVAVLPQQPTAPEGLLVGELVSRGRHPHQGRFRGPSARDRQSVERACEETGITGLIERDICELSGGQRQRVWLAMALAQDTPVLLLDEPTTFLDPAHAVAMLDLVRRQARAGKTVVMVLHDLNLAGQFSDTVVVMRDGRVIARGAPRRALTEAVLAEAYRLRADVWEDPVSQAPLIVPREPLG